MTAVFLAATYARRHEMREKAVECSRCGLIAQCRWIYSDHDYGSMSETLMNTWAEIDTADLSKADFACFFTEEFGSEHFQTGRGGRHVELGLALAARKRIVIVGPVENIYCARDGIKRFGTWAEALEYMTLSKGD